MIEKTSPPKRCAACSTALSYPIKEVAAAFRREHRVSTFRDVLYVSFGEDAHGADHGAFIFPYGAVVMWGLSAEEEETVLATLKTHEISPYEVAEREIMSYSYGSKETVSGDCIILPSSHPNAKLAFSHGLAQSTKLSVFEAVVKKTIATTKAIPEQLARQGSVPLSRKEIRRKMGELFIERSSINLHFDVLDIPEYFWEHPELEPLYVSIATHLELETRVELLNRRLDVIHDLFEMLGNELNHQHSSRLEWTIILLIVIEVFISLSEYFPM
jgi:uncharacterized Rmd1/YagE family protein